LENDNTTKACGRCGKWHTDVELVEGKLYSCTEIRRYWANIRRIHEKEYGHRALISREADGNWICIFCNMTLLNPKEGEK